MNAGDKRVVALRYDGSGAPVVTASGSGELASRIMEIAKLHDIPVYRDTGLAALLSEVDLGAEIPEALYLAIAEVIAFAWMLSAEKESSPVSLPCPLTKVEELSS